MLCALQLFWGLLLGCFCSRDLLLENLALRQQLFVFKERKQRPMLAPFDKVFGIGIKGVWSQSKNSMVLVAPETVMRWHRARFGRYGRLVFLATGMAESVYARKYANSLSEW